MERGIMGVLVLIREFMRFFRVISILGVRLRIRIVRMLVLGVADALFWWVGS